MNSMMDLARASELIRSEKCVLVAGDEKQLSQLPRGNWIGGTTPYFMSEQGGTFARDRVQVLTLPEFVADVDIRLYERDELPEIAKDYKRNGFSYIVIPAFSEIHQVFARDCSGWPGLFDRPLVGWIAGVDVADIGKVAPKVFDGRTGEMSSTKAVVLHADLPSDRYAVADIVNLFRQGDGDTLTFSTAGFEVSECCINGKKESLAKYLTSNEIDSHLPLVADYMGAMVNVSIQSVDANSDKVAFYAPVFPGVEYKIAKPIGDYEREFGDALSQKGVRPDIACNCILNYLYGHLEGKKTGGIVGPITFGEIAYMLLNQTVVHLTFATK